MSEEPTVGLTSVAGPHSPALMHQDSQHHRGIMLVCFFVLFCFVVISWAAPTAYGGSQARGLIGAAAAGLHHSHSNVGSELRLRPTPQPTATPDPQPTE